jgi:glycerol uptake facilitator-like aquaporin
VNNDQSKNISNNDNDNSNKTQSNVKHKYLVEIVGTFILVYATASAATVYSDSGQLGVIGIGLVHASINSNHICYWLSFWRSS